MHGAAGNVLFYRDLALNLDADQPVYGLQALRVNGIECPHKRIEEMASHYIEEIRTVQPDGPYFLAGTSMGGLIAFEMAQQLHAQGQKIGLLAMFDTYAPGYLKNLPNTSLLRSRLHGFVYRVGLHSGNLFLLGPAEQLAYLREKRRIARDRLKRRVRNLSDKISTLTGHPSQRALRKSENTVVKASTIYVAQSFSGRITLFRASKQPLVGYPEPTLGWDKLAGGGVEVHEVPGYHGAIVMEPRVRVLAKQLTACLDKARNLGDGRTNSTSRSKPTGTNPAKLLVLGRNEVDARRQTKSIRK